MRFQKPDTHQWLEVAEFASTACVFADILSDKSGEVYPDEPYWIV